MMLFSGTLVAQQPTSKHFWHTIETDISTDKIWMVWTDVAHWADWDTGLQKATLNVPFELHAKGTIVSLKGQKSKFKIVDLEVGTTYTFKTTLPLGGLFVKRWLEVKDGKTYLTHEVWFSGLTGGLFARLFGDDFKAMLPEVMANVVQKAGSL